MSTQRAEAKEGNGCLRWGSKDRSGKRGTALEWEGEENKGIERLFRLLGVMKSRPSTNHGMGGCFLLLIDGLSPNGVP
jgi:hypothetical protein